MVMHLYQNLGIEANGNLTTGLIAIGIGSSYQQNLKWVGKDILKGIINKRFRRDLSVGFRKEIKIHTTVVASTRWVHWVAQRRV
jgi:hypothetical protein